MLRMNRIGLTIRRTFKIYHRTKFISPPKMPNPWECCGDDCPHCVWTTYFEDIENYNKIKKQIIKKQIRIKNPVSIIR